MDPNYANAGGGGGVGIGGGGGSATTGTASGRYNAAFYKDPLVSCQRSSVPTPYNTYDPYGGSAGSKISSAYPYDAEAEFKERTGMGKTKVLAGNTVGVANSAKIQHHQIAYNQNSCYNGGSYSQSNAPESANYYAYTYEQQPNHLPYTQQQQQQQQQYHHQSQLQQQYKYNKLVVAQQQQQQQQQHRQHQHLQQQKIPPSEYGYTSYHHPYYHPHYHHTSSTQKGVAVMKQIPDASSSMPYVNSKMMTARAPQYPSSYTSYHHHHHPQSSYPPVVTAGHQHTYQSQSVCEDSSRWMWNNNSSSSSSGNEYPNSSCRSATYSGYVNGPEAAAKQQHNSMWPPHSMPMQYQSTGYPAAAVAAAAVMAPNQSCCPRPPPTQSSTTTYYPQQYVKYPIHQSAADYNNDLYGSPSQSNSATTAAVAAAGKVYTDLSGNSYQQTLNNPVSFHHHLHQQQHQQPGEYNASPSSTLDYNCSRYLQQQQQHQQQQQQQTESPSSLSSSSSSTSSYNHHYYHGYPTYSNVETHPEAYQQQVDTKIKSQSLRDFLTSWNEDEDEMNTAATEVPFMEQLHLTSDHFAQDNSGMGNAGPPPPNQPPIMENHLQFKGSFSSSSRPKIHVGITVDSTVESDQYINLPDIIIDIEKSNKDIVSLPEDCLVANIPIIEKEDIFIKEEQQEMPNIKKDIEEEDVLVEEEVDEEKEKYPKKLRNQVQREKNSLRRKKSNHQNLKRIRINKHLQQQRLTTIHRHHRMLKVVRRKKIICRRVKIQPPPICSNVISSPPRQYNPKSLKCLCVSLINSEKFRKRFLGIQSEIDSLLKNNKNSNKFNTTTVAADNEDNIDAAFVAESSLLSSLVSASLSSSSSVIPKLSDLCKNALNSSFDRDVLVINLDEILDSDNLFVVQCDINENILENFVEETEQLQQEQEDSSSSINSRIINNNANNEDEENLVEILNDNNNNYNSGSGSSRSSSNNNREDIFNTVSNDIDQLKRCCSVTEVSNLPLDNSVEHNDFILASINNPLHQPPPPQTPPSPPPPPPSSLTTDGSISCSAKLLCDDGRGHDRHSHSSSSSLIKQNCLTQQQNSVSHNKNNENDENDNNQQLHEMLMLSRVVQPKQKQQHDKNNKDNCSKTFLPPTAAGATAAFDDDDSTLLLDSSKVVTTPSIHHEEIVPDNLKKFQNEKFLKYLHTKYVQGNLSEFYHANRIIKKYKKRIIKKLLNIVR